MCLLRRKPATLHGRMAKVEKRQDEIDRRVNLLETEVQVAMRTERTGGGA